MKKFLIAAAVASAAFATPTFITTALAADVGVSVSIGQPGFYGRIDIGDYPYPQPRVIYSQPRVIERVYVEREPVYMRVPPGHAKNWRKHCHRYNACGERVYFVQDSWYNSEYAPRYREQHYGHQGYQRDNRRDDHRDDQRGNKGKDHSNNGRGHGRDH